MTKHRKTRRSQKGGLFGFFESPPDPYAPKKPSFWESITGSGTSTTPSYQSPNQSSSFFGSSSPSANQNSSFLGPSQNQNSGYGSFQSPARSSGYGSGYGGKRGKQTMTKGKTMKGGKGGLGLTYYASPVSGLQVADPTSWQYYANGTNQYSLTGGSKRSRTRKLTKGRTRKLTKGKSRK